MLSLLFLIELDFCHLVALVIESMNKYICWPWTVMAFSVSAEHSLQVCDETQCGGAGNHHLHLFSVIDLVWADYRGIVADMELNRFTSPSRFPHNLLMLLESRKFGLTYQRLCDKPYHKNTNQRCPVSERYAIDPVVWH